MSDTKDKNNITNFPIKTAVPEYTVEWFNIENNIPMISESDNISTGITVNPNISFMGDFVDNGGYISEYTNQYEEIAKTSAELLQFLMKKYYVLHPDQFTCEIHKKLYFQLKEAGLIQ